MKAMFKTLSFVARHPLNRGRAMAALRHAVAWQLGTRLLPGAVAVPFVENTRLLVTRGQTGATGNVYCGLHEYEDMAFVLHALRPADLFVDVGANIGSYTVLAGGAVGARCISIEPLPDNHAKLLDNLRLNDLGARVRTCNVALGDEPGSIEFTSGLDTLSHVVAEGESALRTIRVPVDTLDHLLGPDRPSLIKIDVEGFESRVVAGAIAALGSPDLLAVLMELNGSGWRYGFDEADLRARMLRFGFRAARYHPQSRRLDFDARANENSNTLFVRDDGRLAARLLNAPRFDVQGRLV